MDPLVDILVYLWSETDFSKALSVPIKGNFDSTAYYIYLFIYLYNILDDDVLRAFQKCPFLFQQYDALPPLFKKKKKKKIVFQFDVHKLHWFA